MPASPNPLARGHHQKLSNQVKTKHHSPMRSLRRPVFSLLRCSVRGQATFELLSRDQLIPGSLPLPQCSSLQTVLVVPWKAVLSDPVLHGPSRIAVLPGWVPSLPPTSICATKLCTSRLPALLSLGYYLSMILSLLSQPGTPPPWGLVQRSKQCCQSR